MPDEPKKNARLAPRMPGGSIGPLRLKVGSTDSFTADVHDVSIFGAGLVGDMELPVGSCFVVEDGPKGRALPKELRAELRHATHRADGRWLLGCSFSRHLTLDDIEILS